MNERITAGRLYSPPIAPATTRTQPLSPKPTQPFQKILNDQLLHFSQHAKARLAQRGIELSPEQLEQIETAVGKAASKGAKDSLIMLSNVAFIVNVQNRTVVTAVDGKSMQDHVFTQIDSAVIINE